MPSTIPAHQGAVLPLKLLSPRRFDGVALVAGTVAPDIGYATEGLGVADIHSHAWHSLLWFSLPVALVIAALVRRASPFIAAHLPEGGPLALRDYGVLATYRHRLTVTVTSALLGALSHQIWDMVTHPYVIFVHPFFNGVTYFPALHDTAVAGLPWWRVIHLASEVLGTALALATIVHIGRKRLLLAWHGPAPVVPRRPILFWSAAATVCAALLGLVLTLPGNGNGLHVVGVRLIAAAVGALLAAAAAVAYTETAKTRS